MKLRHPWLIKTAGWTAALMLRGWMSTLRYQYHTLGTMTEPPQVPHGTRYIYAFWHEYLLYPAFRFAFTDATLLVGQHADGQLFAEIIARLGLRAARGSTTRDGVKGLRALLQENHGHVGITPDGPRGPHRVVQPGLIYLASRLGIPIVPVGWGHERPWRGSSWDRFVIPRPGHRVRCVTEELVHVPADARRDELEAYRLRVEAAIHHATALAERWAVDEISPRDARPLQTPLPTDRRRAS